MNRDLEFKDIEILLNVNDENVQYNINELDQNCTWSRTPLDRYP